MSLASILKLFSNKTTSLHPSRHQPPRMCATHLFNSPLNSIRTNQRAVLWPLPDGVAFRLWLVVPIVLALLCSQALATDPLPAARKLGGVGWNGRVGVPGGIPNRTTIFQVVPAGASLSTVQSAINNCPSG